MSPNLEVLIPDLIDGVESSWRLFIEKYHRILSGVARSYGLNDEADDIAQKVYEALWEKNRSRLRIFKLPLSGGDQAFRAYIVRIARYYCLDTRRKFQKISPSDVVDEIENGLGIPDISLKEYEEAYYDLLMESLELSLRDIPITQKKSLFLHALGYTGKEISERLNTSLGTILSWNSRNKKKLKMDLESYQIQRKK